MPRKTDPHAPTKRQRQRFGRRKESRRGKSAYEKQRRTSYPV